MAATFTHCWQALADELCSWSTFTATSSSSSDDTIMCTDLIDSSVGNTRFANHFVYALPGSSLAGAQRVVTRQGLNEITGKLTVSHIFGGTPQMDDEWALLDRFPVIKQDKTPGLREFLNRGLRDIALHGFISVQGQTNQPRYTLPTSVHWWITEPRRIVNVYQPYPNSSDRRVVDPQDWEIIHDGETVILQFNSGGYNASDRFEIEVWRPGNSRMRVNGIWRDQSSPLAGFSNADDEAAPPMYEIIQSALAEAYKHISHDPGLAEAKSFWQREWKLQDVKADFVRLHKRAESKPRPWQFVGSTYGGM